MQKISRVTHTIKATFKSLIGFGHLRRFARNRGAAAGLVVIVGLVITSLGAEYMTPYSPLRTLTGEAFEPPNYNHPLGTDHLGRDIYSGILYGTRISLLVGFSVATASFIIGVFVGSIAGYLGGRADNLLMGFTEIFLIIPSFFLALIFCVMLGNNINNIIIVLSFLSWPATARLTRAEFLSLKEWSFVEAVEALGARKLDVIFKEILPNAIGPAVVNGTLQISSAILVEAGLSFVGVGDPNVISWGQMLMNAQRYLTRAWWMAIFPGLAIFVSCLAFNLVGDGLSDALNPRLRER